MTTASVATKTATSTWDQSIATTGNGLSSAEQNLMQAYSVKEGSAAAKALAKKLGAPAGTSVEGLQLLAKNAYDKMSRSMSLLSQILESIHQRMMQVINNIK